MHNGPLRLGAFVAVTVAHAALFLVFARTRFTAVRAPEPETSMILFMLPRSEDAALAAAAGASRPAPARRPRPQESPQVTPVETSPESAPSSAPVMIDWAKEAQLAAGRQIDADEANARRATALSTHKRVPEYLAPPPAQRQFGWSHANTHRIESFPGGGFILNLNDHCAIVFTIMVIPVCKMGTIEPRGDLFLHLHDPPLLGRQAADAP
jgi:hypothetical protein